MRRTGLARATVGSLVADLIKAGIVVEEGTHRPDGLGTGRPPRSLALNPQVAYAVGVEIGRDHVQVMLCDLAGEPVWGRGLQRAADRDAGGVLAQTTELIGEAQKSADVPAERVLGIGVGIACPIDRAGALHAEGIMPGWVGVRPADELRERTGLAVQLVNDANAGVLAEHRYGAARQSGNVLYIRLSTGVGAGLICDGRLLLGFGGLAGELGHVTVEPRGVICRCGNRGCLETVANPAAITSLMSSSEGRMMPAAELIDRLRAGDRPAMRVMEDAGDAVGRALAMAVSIFNPELVVIGGDLADVGDALLEPIRRAIRRDCMSAQAAALQVVPGALGGSAGVRGAAALVLADAPERLAALLAG
jgi:predicted NBD/HSP70 family sugar kinase